MPYRILVCYGTRPEWIKVKPVVSAMRRDDRFEATILFTGQHKDIHGGVYDMQLPKGNSNTGNRLNNIFVDQLSDTTINWDDYDAVLVQGDTASVFAMGLQAYHHKIPIIHLEAGMRTYDLQDPYPEEGYRQMISRIANLHLCPTEQEKNHLLLEEIDTSMISVVGNTVLDNISHLFPVRGNTVLITMHRRENEKEFSGYFSQIVQLAHTYTDMEFVFPMHPTEMIQQHKGIFDGSRVRVVDPMQHNEFIVKLSNCAAVITDSGGVQEEAVFLNKPTVVCRKQMERNLCEGDMSFQCPDSESLSDVFQTAMSTAKESFNCPYGDGNSASKVVDAIDYYMENLR